MGQTPVCGREGSGLRWMGRKNKGGGNDRWVEMPLRIPGGLTRVRARVASPPIPGSPGSSEGTNPAAAGGWSRGHLILREPTGAARLESFRHSRVSGGPTYFVHRSDSSERWICLLRAWGGGHAFSGGRRPACVELLEDPDDRPRPRLFDVGFTQSSTHMGSHHDVRELVEGKGRRCGRRVLGLFSRRSGPTKRGLVVRRSS